MFPFKISKETQMEEFSIAFIHAIVSTAGYGLEFRRIDNYSIDVMITQKGTNEMYPDRKSVV